jgi:hypothetical protein
MATVAVGLGKRRFDRLFFSSMAVVILITVYIGFAPTYFRAGVFYARLPNVLIHLHAAAFSCWIILLVTQTSLVAAGRVDLHRRLGLAGFGLACFMVIVGVLAATNFLVRGIDAGQSMNPRAFYGVILSDIVVFATLVSLAFRNRRDPAAHKRFILIATIALLDAAFIRWPFAALSDLHIAQIFCYPFLLALAAYDFWSTGRIHRVTLWASVLVIVMQVARYPIGRSAVWQAFAAWVEGIAR